MRTTPDQPHAQTEDAPAPQLWVVIDINGELYPDDGFFRSEEACSRYVRHQIDSADTREYYRDSMFGPAPVTRHESCTAGEPETISIAVKHRDHRPQLEGETCFFDTAAECKRCATYPENVVEMQPSDGRRPREQPPSVKLHYRKLYAQAMPEWLQDLLELLDDIDVTAAWMADPDTTRLPETGGRTHLHGIGIGEAPEATIRHRRYTSDEIDTLHTRTHDEAIAGCARENGRWRIDLQHRGRPLNAALTVRADAARPEAAIQLIAFTADQDEDTPLNDGERVKLSPRAAELFAQVALHAIARA